jgi:hypothetical protein
MLWNLKTLAASAIATTTLVAGTAWYSYNRGEQSGMSAIQTKWDAAQMVQTAAQMEEIMKARQTEQALQKLVDQQKQEHRREVNRIVSRYNADLERLRNRPEARSESPTGLPEGAAVGVGCTGAGLSKPDAEFLSWYSASAARTQAALNACVEAYDQVRREVNGE